MEIEHFSLDRELGAGAMGVVYRAYDRRRDSHVALKMLSKVHAAGIYRFKQEFRALADVLHPNLVQLYELVSRGDEWFFTMELVDGVDFLSYVRKGPAAFDEKRDENEDEQSTHTSNPDDAADKTADTAPGQSGQDTLTSAEIPSQLESTARSDSDSSSSRPGRRRPDPLTEPAQFERLRRGLRQLAAGITALHGAGHLHRDIKPSNVMVTRDERVVVLDFGVVTELAKQRSGTGGFIVGTPAYMAPEQAAGRGQLTEASDWYAVGVMTFEALVGRRPFYGAVRQLLAAKQRDDAPPLQLVEGVPGDLAEVTMGLLARIPEQRAGLDELLEVVGGGSGDEPSFPAIPAGATPSTLVGRDRHLAELRRAYDATRAAEARTVIVLGGSGTGKSVLCSHFLDELDKEATVLTGRCYEQETVPYKALDSLIDSLTRHLQQLSAEDVAELLPRNIHALARLFPVLHTVDAVLGAAPTADDSLDPQELRRRGFTALRRLLTRMAERRPLVLFIDDLQWADIDSASVLAEVLRPPDPPSLLILATCRSEHAESNEFLARIVDVVPDEGLVRLKVDRLERSEAIELATALLSRSDKFAGDAQAAAATIARESGGNPYFISDLVWYVTEGDADSLGRDVTLGDVLGARLSRLPDPARRLLEVVAVAGRPVAREVAKRAADLGSEERSALALLRTTHLVRGAGEDAVEAYHNRICVGVVEHLDEQRLRECHRRLAAAIEATDSSDVEALAAHFEAAGEPERAAAYCRTAAGAAAKALAFDRAALLYGRALELEPNVDDAAALETRRGESLGYAGRGAEAADAFLLAAAEADPDTRLALRARASEQLLLSGNLERGEEALRTLLADVGVRMPSSPAGVLASLLWNRLCLRLRGLGWKERAEQDVDPKLLLRLDALKAASLGLALVDNVRGADFQSRGLRLALKVGEPSRVGLFLSVESSYLAAQGGAGLRRGRALADAAQQLADRTNDRYLDAVSVGAEGYTNIFEGRFDAALRRIDLSEAKFAEITTATAWETDTLQLFRLITLRLMGSFRELRESFDRLVVDAARRGDAYMESTLRRAQNVVWLAQDRPDLARLNLDKAPWMPVDRGVHLQHAAETESRLELGMYEGSVPVDELHPQLDRVKKSLWYRVQMIRILMKWHYARLTLWSGDHRAAAKWVRALEGEGLGWATVFARVVRAGLALQEGRHEDAVAGYRNAVRVAENNGMMVCAATSRRRLGVLLGGDEGAAMVVEADQFMKGERIRNPKRMTRVFAPAPRGDPP